MRSVLVNGRLSIKRFGLLAIASLLIVLTVTSLLQLATPAQAQTAPTTPAQTVPAQVAPAPSAQPNKATDAVLDWNATALSVLPAPPAPQQYRGLAIVHAAIFDAVNAIDRRYATYAVEVKAPAGASAEAAAATAGHDVLVRLYPSQQTAFDAALTTSLAKIAAGQAKEDGIKVGQEVAEQLVALRSKDGADQKGTYKAESRPGIWQPTLPAFAPALLPQWGTVKPFAIQRADQFKIAAPLPLNSNAYAKELNEVKRLGGRNSTARTPDQTAAAIWSPAPPAVIWNAAARAAAIAKGNTLIENARLFALLNIAGVDAYIAGYDVKYKYKLWRPVTAIRNADTIGNPNITPDPTWEPLIVSPAHPDYISGHCVTAGAAERILQNFFGNDAVNVSIIFPANVGVTRSFSTFSQIAKELGEAHIWGGVHTRTADSQGDVLGKQVGDYVFNHALLPLKG
ncbi:MAG: vanadium-dependent haloperoxidase [Stenomitos rutilans HA7619-LM2]|nr:vanadium-dependent haloperoxidase [Stenomitos rutilans HA7619-LM2]